MCVCVFIIHKTEKLSKMLSIAVGYFNYFAVSNATWWRIKCWVKKQRLQPLTNLPQVEPWHAQLTAADMRCQLAELCAAAPQADWWLDPDTPVAGLNEQTCLPTIDKNCRRLQSDWPPALVKHQCWKTFSKTDVLKTHLIGQGAGWTGAIMQSSLVELL